MGRYFDNKVDFREPNLWEGIKSWLIKELLHKISWIYSGKRVLERLIIKKNLLGLQDDEPKGKIDIFLEANLKNALENDKGRRDLIK